MNYQLDSLSRDNALPLETEFKLLCQSLSVLLSSTGLKVRGHLPGVPHFRKLEDQQKSQVVSRLRFYHDLCQEQISEGYSLRDSMSFTWRALTKLGLAPRSDLFTKITNEHIVEIYSTDNVQLYCNLNFYEYCSYTLEELHTLPWWELFERDSRNTQQIFDHTMKIFKGEILDNVKPAIDKHVLKELNSSSMFTMEYTVELMGPLFKNKRPEAFIILEKARILAN